MSLVRIASFLVLATSATGCMGLMPGMSRTPMPATEVDALTVCKETDLAKIKKNLVLNGYAIRNASDDMIETDFKQVEGSGTSKFSERISVVKLDDGKAKFKVRVKHEGVEKVETGQMKSSTGQVIATDSKLVSTENEEDEKYFAETRPNHEATHKSVCGQ